MDIQTRKIHFIQEFLKITSEELISKFEQILKSENLNFSDTEKKAYTMGEFIQMINDAENDAISGNVFSTNDIKNELSGW